MEATRARISFPADWRPAALLLAATLLVGSLVVRELRVAPVAFASRAAISTDAPAAVVPSDAVSVAVLTVGGAAPVVRVGDPAAAALARLGPALALAIRAFEPGPLGPREVRAYDSGDTRVFLVLEPFARGGEPRVAGIYLQ